MRICKELSVQVPKNDLCKFRSFGHVDTTNLNTKELTRMYTDGTNESASLVEGPTGFAVATIRGIVVTTEVPNIMLAQKMKIMKKPCGAETKKRPAAAVSEPTEKEEEEEDEEDLEEEEAEEEEHEHDPEEEASEAADETAEPVVKTYSKMWYKNYFCFGIRQNFLGRKQIGSLGGKRWQEDTGRSRQFLERIATDMIGRMENEEMTEAEAVEWATQTIRLTSETLAKKRK